MVDVMNPVPGYGVFSQVGITIHSRSPKGKLLTELRFAPKGDVIVIGLRTREEGNKDPQKNDPYQ